MTVETWAEFARHPHLVSIWSSPLMTSDLITTILDAVPKPFRLLTRLQCNADSNAFIQLIPHILNLKTLRLTLPKQSAAILSELSQLTQLQRLRVFGPMVNDPHSILTLAERCPHLIELSICSSGEEPVEIDDTLIDHLARLSPQICDLQLCIRSRLSTRSLRSLGTNCRRLSACWLEGGINLLDLDIDGPLLFPILEELSLYDMYGRDWRPNTSKGLIPIMDHHMPNLHRFRIDRQAIKDEVNSALRNRPQFLDRHTCWTDSRGNCVFKD